MTKLRVLLVDANADFLQGVAAWLSSEASIEVVGSAVNGRKAIEEVERLRPDLVLTDGTMPEMDGFEMTRRIKAENVGAPLVVLTTFHDSESTRNEAWAAGADGYIAKSAIPGGLLELVRELIDGPQANAKLALNMLPKPGPSSDL